MKQKLFLFFAIVLNFIILQSCKTKNSGLTDEDIRIEKRVDSVMELMTLDEKIGQMNQLNNPGQVTGPVHVALENEKLVKLVREGKVGSLLNIFGAELCHKMQKVAVEESRMKIPLLYGLDVIHGFQTIFPVPLATASSWDLAAIEKSEHVAAVEASSTGLHWTFAPMVDICRDPRWGRIVEGAGEDPFLGSKVAAARVRGFQGQKFDGTSIAACVKHFAMYGAAESGKDYNTTDMSERLMREIYLPPYKAAIDAGAATLMTAFNELNGTPASANVWLQTEILRKEWGFKGMVVSDWASMKEVMAHRAAANKAEATQLGINSNIDMDMQGYLYNDTLKSLVEKHIVTIKQIDNCVRRILRLKFKLGLFDNPYQYGSVEKEKSLMMCSEHMDAALDMSRKSIVLLKNENQILPLSKGKTVAVIGPLADSQKDMLGTWKALGDYTKAVSYLQGIKKKIGADKVLYHKGCNTKGYSTDSIASAVSLAQKSDVVLLFLGESEDMSGEAHSRAYINLPGVQEQLFREIVKTGKPVIVILTNGRPLELEQVDNKANAIVEAWHLGTRAGDAVADVLFGDYNPSGKLTVSFPRTIGQIPIYYNHKNTGRPKNDEKTRYVSRYIDCENTPLYPFGYGLSYTTFKYENLKLSKDTIGTKDTVIATITVKNTGNYDGEEIVQMYINDLFAYGISRPVKELKGFEKVFLKKGEEKIISIKITPDLLSYLDAKLKRIVEPGEFKIMLGSSSEDKDLSVSNLFVK